MTYSPISQAASFALRGFSPIPIKPRSKVPGFGRLNMNDWSSFCLRQATAGEIARWALMDPRAGLGIACGFNGLIAVDVDDAAAIPAAREVFGHFRAPSKIGRKGATAFFRDPTGKIASRKFLKRTGPDGKRQTLVEILGLGNQTVLPPTIHPDTGLAYRWHNQPLSELSVFDLPVLDEHMLHELKDLLAPLMEREREFEPATTFKSNESLSDFDRRRYQGLARSALSRLKDRLASQPMPGRGRELYTVACFMAPYVRERFIDATKVAEELIGACENNKLIARNGKNDVIKTINRAFREATDQLPDLSKLADRPMRRAA